MASADWSSLPAELVSRIADCFLATNDLDYFMDFRAVCQSWRSATEDPKISPDPLFRPRHWVIIDRSFGGDKTYLWANTATGRFVPKELPLLRNYWGSSTTPDGLLILMDNKLPYAVILLNAFTGYRIRFAAPLPDQIMESAALVSGSPPTLVLSCKKMDIDDDLVLHETDRKVYTAYPESESFAVFEERHACPLIRLALRGIYTNGELGSVAPFPIDMAEKIFTLMRIYNAEPDASSSSDDEDVSMSDEKAAFNFLIGYDNRCYLLRSAGEILIILKLKGGMEVYKMDTQNYILESVKNIGNRAIFLSGNCKCISLNADKFPSVDANCIYYIKSLDYSGDYICMYNLRFRREEKISKDMGCGSRPYTIIQHLSSYDLQ
ncbi:uncharacterized protein At1g65760-like [Lolium perenne]|uniref:uncharacterized protein At1g65760-like n=1 Tax=Lolium perenne TaxID=4522 RepID=UPI0021E9F207|nr:uncharacterized protein LOC127345882 [Lolium perenne]